MTTPNVDLDGKIPNNVGLADDVKLRRALETWLPQYLEWWNDMGPSDFADKPVFLRTAVSVEPGGWAHYDYVKMPDYRWGIFLDPSPEAALIKCGDDTGKPAWADVPGEHRNTLRRIIVTQADTEPASVEQQRMLGHIAPSLYDLRNLFQVNVEEGRHLWAMVYLLHKFFGRDGRDEADELLLRRSGNPDKPRILGAFNQPCDHWLSFFAFTMFTDRDGKYQLAALSESGFDPLARTTQFMLTEEAHHLFVGETGMDRIVKRSAELQKLDKNGDVRNQGGIDFDLIQRTINYWYTYSLDLFGGEISSNASTFFATGLKGRYREDQYSDHRAIDGSYRMPVVESGKLIEQDVPVRNAMNEVLRDAYVADCERALRKWNKTLEAAGSPTRLSLPSRRFHRHQGIYAESSFDPAGNLISREEYEANKHKWILVPEDNAYLLSIMKPCYEPGKFANWIAAPNKGIEGKPVEFEYVRLD
ncbi:MAG: benzoyl-CoA 2,3-epoxidase subunit BoxB [Deltaproteobacteria bacterium]|nr:benzoyl-CoA 2,3-epoxidase subunit BoxB [Deltaproteobacteria bacterium]MBK8235080.1 benzoyl-CoA 2,3-epoxidase subunit BoxB [Deltaproteobacteria bacterium]MBK8716607.1 benzoyl-CoA 2,3-epoxidase subunit BoxB [Deltaproteobacteria bacterium]MBP7292283.1 benzoyl-CoA 2,3-epoxidase subunit BoxB [Nannocystaceae bacterium]